MIPRGRLDLTLSDIFAGIRYSLRDIILPAKPDQGIISQNTSRETQENNTLSCLSVRTGFDLLLTALNFPAGTTILVTAINIPDMFQIMAAHQLICVPLPVSKTTLGISAAELEAAINPSVKAILITHLFGGIMETEAILTIAAKNKLMVIEDCAQAYQGSTYQGHPQSDVVLYSFGLIKTNTAVSGAVIQLNRPSHYSKVKALNDRLPIQKTSIYLKKLCKVLCMHLLTKRIVYTLFYKAMVSRGKDFDQVLSGFTRGFPGNDPLKKIRYRPCHANKKLLQRKLERFSADAMAERQELAHLILENIPEEMKIGMANEAHTYWVLPVSCPEPESLIRFLRSAGYDATSRASSLVKLGTRDVTQNEFTPSDELQLDKLVYLPMYATMKTRERSRLGFLIKTWYTAQAG